MKKIVILCIVVLLTLWLTLPAVGCQQEANPVQEIGYFPTSGQISTWLDANKDLQTSEISSIYEDYQCALELQQRALKDSYIINVYLNTDEVGDFLWVWCDAYTQAGDIYYWTMLDFGDIAWFGNW